MLATSACALALASCSGGGDNASAPAGDSVSVGVLQSLTGTMAISEITVKNAEMLAIEEINATGGVLGKQINALVEDGASDPSTFAQKASKLIESDGVSTVFGGWTSSSRKAMLPVFEDNDALLYYPVQYEGMEASPYIFYTGATTNQQIIPALDYLKEQGVKSLYLVGSDYVFPQTANREIKAYAASVTTESAQGQDVTEQFTDLEAQLRNAKAQEEEYLEILGQAETVEEILMVQSYLSSVRYTIESLEGRIQYLENRTSYSTISVAMSEEPTVRIPTKDFRFGATVSEAGQALVAILQNLAVAAIWLVVVGGGILLPAGLVVWAIVRIVAKSRRR